MTQQRRRLAARLAGLVLAAMICAAGAYAFSRGKAPLFASSGGGQEAAKKGLAIDDAERKLLWEIEHEGLVLAKEGFSVIAKAVIKADRAVLENTLAANFTAETPSARDELAFDSDFATAVRRESDRRDPLTAEAFVSDIMNMRANFEDRPKVKLALMALKPADRDRPEGAWSGGCQFRVWGHTKTGKPAEFIAYWTYEIDRPDASRLAAGKWLRKCSITRRQWSEAPKRLFAQVARERGIATDLAYDNWDMPKDELIPITGGVYLTDYDRDGCLDMLVSDVRGIWLYQGMPDGKFRMVNELVGLTVPEPNQVHQRATAVAFADIDNDGWEDLILGSSVLKNHEGKRFINQTYRTAIELLASKVIGFALADYDGDGLVDIYVLNEGTAKSDSWIEGRTGLARSNRLWRNLGGFRFEDATEKTGVDGGGRSAFTAAWLDADGDHRPDLYVINEFGNGVLYLNRPGRRFEQASLYDGPSDFGTMGVAAGDIDNDGKTDLYLANMYSKAGNRIINNLRPDAYSPDIMARMKRFVTGSELYRNLGGNKFDRLGAAMHVADVGWAYGPALADINNDGYLDIFATSGFVSQSRDDPDG